MKTAAGVTGAAALVLGWLAVAVGWAGSLLGGPLAELLRAYSTTADASQAGAEWWRGVGQGVSAAAVGVGLALVGVVLVFSVAVPVGLGLAAWLRARARLAETAQILILAGVSRAEIARLAYLSGQRSIVGDHVRARALERGCPADGSGADVIIQPADRRDVPRRSTADSHAAAGRAAERGRAV